MSHYSEPQNLTTFGDLFSYTQSVSESTFGPGIVFALYISVFLFFKFKGNNWADSLAVSGYVTVGSTVYLFILGLTTPVILLTEKEFFLLIFMSVLSIFFAYFQRE